MFFKIFTNKNFINKRIEIKKWCNNLLFNDKNNKLNTKKNTIKIKGWTSVKTGDTAISKK